MATVLPKTTVLERLQRGRLYGAVHLRDPLAGSSAVTVL